MSLDRDLDEAVDHVMGSLAGLGLHPDVPEGVRALESAGDRLVTFTNGSAQVAENLFSTAGIRDAFDLLLSVERAPAWKPARKAYGYAADACGVEPGQMMLVAVHPWDIHGAARANLGTAWINRTSAPYPAHFAAPDHTMESLRHLAPALAQQGL